MGASDDEKCIKKSKKLSKSQLNDSGDSELTKKIRKKKKKSAMDDSNLMENHVDSEGKALPNWLEMTDSEEEFQPSEIKPKKKKRRSSEKVEEHEMEESRMRLSKESPKKKKRKPKLAKLDENGDDTVVDYSDHQSQLEENEGAGTRNDLLNKGKKKKKSSLNNVFTEDEPENDNKAIVSEKVVSKKSSKSIDFSEGPDKTSNNSVNKKKRKKRDSETSTQEGNHDENVGDDLQGLPMIIEKIKEEEIENSFDGFDDTDNGTFERPPKSYESRPGRVTSILQLEQQKEEREDEFQEPVPQQPVKKIIKRKTKIPQAEQLTLGAEYKMKICKEKICKSCNENVKIKIKTSVRDMGTQTAESATVNRIVGRKRTHPMIKTAVPVSCKDRIIFPREPAESIYTPVNCTVISDELKSKLRNMTINLKHEPLPQHNIGFKNVSRPLTKEEKEEFNKYHSLTMGVFQPTEDEVIVQNWKKFCKRHDWDHNIAYPFVVLRYQGAYFLPKTEQRRRFVQFLANGLPDRALNSIYRRFKILFSTHRTERYTPEEDEMILKYVQNRPDSERGFCRELAETLNRTRESIWRRYRILALEQSQYQQ